MQLGHYFCTKNVITRRVLGGFKPYFQIVSLHLQQTFVAFRILPNYGFKKNFLTKTSKNTPKLPKIGQNTSKCRKSAPQLYGFDPCTPFVFHILIVQVKLYGYTVPDSGSVTGKTPKKMPKSAENRPKTCAKCRKKRNFVNYSFNFELLIGQVSPALCYLHAPTIQRKLVRSKN